MRSWIVMLVLLGCAAEEAPLDGAPAGIDGGRPSRPDAPFMRPDAPTVDGALVPSSGCGLSAPAFCDDFEEGPSDGGRSGELDPARWAVLRGGPGDTAYENAFRVGPGRAPTCRPDVTGRVVGPDDDVFVCEPTEVVSSRHLVTVVGSQNYGVHGYRIRQPFDFVGRTGTLAFDVDARGQSLCGFVGVTIAGEPTPRPAFGEWEHASGPRDGIEIVFDGDQCHEGNPMSPSIHVFRDYVEVLTEQPTECVHVAAGLLGHFEVYVSAGHVELWGSDASADGDAFASFHLLWAGDVDLGFERGHVTLAAYNHATIKYWCGAESVSRWDDVGFDGPVVGSVHEHGVADSLDVLPGVEGCLTGATCTWVGDYIPENDQAGCDEEAEHCTYPLDAHNVGYTLPNASETPLRLEIPGVTLAGATSASLVAYGWYPYFDWLETAPTDQGVRFRWNGGPWHERPVSATEARAIENPEVTLGVNQIVEVDVTELVEGTNVLELTGLLDHTGYPVGWNGIDLRIETE